MKTNADRQAEYKDRKKNEGYTQMNVWVKPEWKEHIEFFIQSLKNSEKIVSE